MNKYKIEIETNPSEPIHKIELLTCEFLANNHDEAHKFSEVIYKAWSETIIEDSGRPARVINLKQGN